MSGRHDDSSLVCGFPVKKVLKEAEDGDIILMHDIFDTSVSAALELIDILQREGYTFVTADELMID